MNFDLRPSVKTVAGEEEARIEVLESLNLLDSPASESFDRITRLASTLFNAPITAISLTDRSRQWFKSSQGVSHQEIPRNGAPCAEVTATQKLLHIPDLLADDCYQDCLLAQRGIRFYAGVPLTTLEGHTLGALCLLDTKPRELSIEQLEHLTDMAAMVMSQVGLQHEVGRIDPVSGLSNRHQLAQDVEDLARSSKQTNRVLLLIELADIRHLNEFVSVLGSSYFEDLLRACGSRLKAALPRWMTLYHVGFATVALLLDDGVDPWQQVIQTISDALEDPIESGGGVITVVPGFGVAPFDVRKTSANDAIKMATSAVSEARDNDLQYALYDESSYAGHRRRFAILRCLRESLLNGTDFHLVYQPRIEASSGYCVAAEALLRWSHPELGSVSPGEFFPVIEQTSLAGPMTLWVIEHALAQLSEWKKTGIDSRISINVSARNLEDPHFADQVAMAMASYGIQPGEIELEFTESALIRHEERVYRQLSNLRQLGIELAIDDFGAGYSSLSYLQKLPAQIVKLDRSFIRNVAERGKDARLVGAVIEMSHDLGYRVVAEGVETRKAYELLKALQCDEIQGYFFARPLPPAEFAAFARADAARFQALDTVLTC